MINPFKLSDYFIPISNYFKRVYRILLNKLIYRMRKQTYLENNGISYAYINGNSWMKIDYNVVNLVYLKFENFYYFNHKSSFIINLQNFKKDKISLVFKGISDEIVYEIYIQDYIKTDFSDFSISIKKKQIRLDPKLISNFIIENDYKFNCGNISVQPNHYKIKLTNYNKSDYVRG